MELDSFEVRKTDVFEGFDLGEEFGRRLVYVNNPKKTTIVQSEIARAKIQKLYVEPNDYVMEGDILVEYVYEVNKDAEFQVNWNKRRAEIRYENAYIQKDLMEAVEVVIAGKEKKDRVMNPKEREMVAYHEVGHALVSALQKNSQPVQKITIVPRTMGSLGYTMSMPEEERYLMTESEILAQITTLLGGRAAENLIFGEVSTGASNDIERATKLARGMITQYGMSDKFGPMGLESTQNQYLDGRNVAHHSEQTGALIDKEVSNILVQCQQNAFNLLQDNKDALERISKYLLEKENITGKEFMQLLEETRSK